MSMSGGTQTQSLTDSFYGRTFRSPHKSQRFSVAMFFWGVLLLISLLAMAPAVLFAQAAGNSQGTARRGTTFEELSRPSMSKTSAEEAIRKIPWQVLAPAERQKVESIVSQHTLYRRLPMTGGYCNPELFDFLLCNPELVVGFWEVLGFTEMKLKRTAANEYTLREKTGTVGKITVLYQTDETVLIWCDGAYRGPVTTGEIQGEMFIMIQVRYTEDVKGKPIVLSRLDSFIRVRNVGIDLMTRVFGPVLGKIADSNFEQTFAFMANLSQSAEENPSGLQNMTTRVTTIQEETRQDFLALTERVNEQSRLRLQGHVFNYYLLPKGEEITGNPARILAREGNRPRPATEPLPPAPNIIKKVQARRSSSMQETEPDIFINDESQVTVSRPFTPPTNPTFLPRKESAVPTPSTPASTSPTASLLEESYAKQYTPTVPDTESDNGKSQSNLGLEGMKVQPLPTSPTLQDILRQTETAEPGTKAATPSVSNAVREVPEPALLELDQVPDKKTSVTVPQTNSANSLPHLKLSPVTSKESQRPVVQPTPTHVQPTVPQNKELPTLSIPNKTDKIEIIPETSWRTVK